MGFENHEDKLKWAHSLKVGDVVCDCRYEHLAIKEISKDDYGVDLILEDGARCSAMHCCDPADHEWKHEER